MWNDGILQLLEGEGRFNPLQLMRKIERCRYKKLRRDICKLEGGQDRSQLLLECANRFPDDEKLLMATSLGNTIRAFEEYPFVMYGLDASGGWPRLLGVMPENYRNFVSQAKARVDFWANLCVLGLFFLIEYLVLFIITRQLTVLCVPILALLIAWLSYGQVRKSAQEWGRWVKAAFDLFLPELYKQLGFPVDIDAINVYLQEHAQQQETHFKYEWAPEGRLWRRFGWAINYRRPEYMPPRHLTQNQAQDS